MVSSCFDAGATKAAKKLGAKLSYAAGKSSSDNASQIAAIENMTTAGVKGILITVADGKAENPAIAKARKAGVLVIALDTPTVPKTATDALFATDNFNAGVISSFGTSFPPSRPGASWLKASSAICVTIATRLVSMYSRPLMPFR